MFLAWVYYRHLLGACLIFSLISLYKRVLARPVNHKPKDVLAFKALLNGIYTELLIGKSFRNALVEARRHLVFEDPRFLQEVDLLIKDIHFQNQEMMAWQRFASAMTLQACDQFVDVLQVTYDYGGQVTQVLKHTIKGLTDQMDLEMEIDIIVFSKRFEFLLMICIPVFMLLVMSYGQYDYMAVLYQTLLGRVVMTLALITQGLAYVIGRHMTEIEV